MLGRDFRGEKYRFGFNRKEDIHELSDWQDYGERMYMTRLGRFPNIDPLTAKFPMLSPFQFASLNPIANIDLDGLEGFPSVFHTALKGAGITTVTAQQSEHNVKAGIVKAGRISQDASIIAGSAIAIWASGGSVLPAIPGFVSLASGGGKLYYDVKGEYKKSDDLQTSISGAVMGSTNYIVGEEVFCPEIISTASFLEDVVSLNKKSLSSPILQKKVSEAMNRFNLGIDAVKAINSGEAEADGRYLLSTNNSTISELNRISAPKDNVRIDPPVRPVTPVIIHYQGKKTEQNKTTKKGK